MKKILTSILVFCIMLMCLVFCIMLMCVACTDNTENETPNEEGTQMIITIGTKSFTATLADNETAKAFKEKLPLTLDMSELNGNEKYNYLSENLPSNSSGVGTIHEGDIMLYGSNCVVLFYETFSTSYSYTRMGCVNDTTGLKEALGSGSVSVTFFC